MCQLRAVARSAPKRMTPAVATAHCCFLKNCYSSCCAARSILSLSLKSPVMAMAPSCFLFATLTLNRAAVINPAPSSQSRTRWRAPQVPRQTASVQALRNTRFFRGGCVWTDANPRFLRSTFMHDSAHPDHDARMARSENPGLRHEA